MMFASDLRRSRLSGRAGLTRRGWQFLLLAAFASGTVLRGTDAIRWLATGNTVWNATQDCQTPAQQSVLSAPQRQICSRHIDLMEFVSFAARLTVDLCQELFADRRWNCSSILLAPDFSADLTGGSREQAFVYALSSASVVHAVAKACSTGQSSKCHCATIPNETPPRGHRWGGCGDDVQFASSFGAEFTDTHWLPGKKRRKLNKKALVILHNNNAGRAVLLDHLKTTCKCHGVSGACTIKTCYKSLPVMRTVAVAIQRRHETAIEVRRTAGRRKAPADASTTVPRQQDAGLGGAGLKPSSANGLAVRTDRINGDALVYYTISPDYCLPDDTLGSVGTRHRECRVSDADDNSPSTCRSMCCGRGYVTELETVTRRCDCKYYWCCYVRCKTCTRTVQTYRCR